VLTNRNRSVSIDNGPKWEYTKRLVDGTLSKYRKDTLPIYIDKLASDFELEFLEYDCAPDIGSIENMNSAPPNKLKELYLNNPSLFLLCHYSSVGTRVGASMEILVVSVSSGMYLE